MNSFTEFVKALAWPLLIGVIAITQRKPLGALLGAVTGVLDQSRRVKIGELIDLEIDRTVQEAARLEVPTGEAASVSPREIEIAAKVNRIAENVDLSSIRARVLEFAHEYEATRSNMKPGGERTRAMNEVVTKMRALGIAAKPLLPELTRQTSSPGQRLAALAILQFTPDLEYLDWVSDRMKHEQPFVFYHASHVLLAMVRTFGGKSRSGLEKALRHSLETIRSFAGGPDRNTVEILERALSELVAMSAGGR